MQRGACRCGPNFPLAAPDQHPALKHLLWLLRSIYRYVHTRVLIFQIFYMFTCPRCLDTRANPHEDAQ